MIKILKRLKKAYLLALLICLFAVSWGLLVNSTGVEVASAATNSSSAVAFDEVTIVDKALLGEELDLPSVSATVGSEEVDTTCCVYKPNGDVVAGESILFDVTGRYVVEYSVVNDNVKYKSEKYIQVYDEYFSFSDEKSTLYYGENKNYSGVNGLNVELATGGKLIYNAPIDMTDKTKDDALATFSIIPHQKGKGDADYIYIVLSDIYNPDNYIEIRAWNNADSQVYIQTTANGHQDRYGLRPNTDTINYYYNGQPYKLWKNSWGTFFPMSFACKNYEVGAETFSFSFDYKEKQLFFDTDKNGNTYLVFDFDDPTLSPINFEGFESGRCFMTVYAEGLVASTADLLFKTVDGIELSQKPTDPVESIINVDAPEVIPHAVVGSTYPCFDAFANVATNNQGELYTSVYYYYYSSVKSEVPVVDGRFKVDYEGLYTIEYMVVDKFGGKTIETIDVQAVKRDKLSATVKEDTQTHKAGVLNDIPDLDVKSSYDAENIDVKVFGSSGDGKEFEIKDSCFIPDKVGAYLIRYVVTDFADTIEVEYLLNVDNNITPIFVDAPVYDEYIIENAIYDVLPIESVVYKNGQRVDVPVTAKINRLDADKNEIGEKEIKNNTFSVKECAFVEVLYTATFENKTEQYSVILPVISVGYASSNIVMEKYFVDKVGEANRQVGKLETKFTYAYGNTVNGVGKMQFANNIVVDRFESSFGKVGGADTKLNVYLRDRINSDEQVKLTFLVVSTEMVSFLINDEPSITYSKNMIKDLISVSYNSFEKKVILDGVQYCNIDTYMNGKVFNGFSSNYVYLEFEVEGVQTEKSFVVSSIVNQVFGNYKYDSVKPYYSLAKNTGLQSLGKVYTIEPTYFADVLDPNITYSMTVYMPDKSIAKSVDGIELKNIKDTSRAYQIVLDAYGDYAIRFTASDFMGNSHKQVGYSLVVKDEVSPTLEVTDYETEVKVGEAIELPKITVSDDLDAAEDIKIFINVYSPEGLVSGWVTDEPLVLDLAGKYTVQVFCYDKSNNMARFSYTVTVKE